MACQQNLPSAWAGDTMPSCASSWRRRDAAIRIAARAGIPLKIAAKVDRVDREYFKTTIEPLLSQGDIEFIGEISEDQKQEFLGNAAGLLFPIAWREPFGLVMIEDGRGTPS